jgi:hypothetical protein
MVFKVINIKIRFEESKSYFNDGIVVCLHFLAWRFPVNKIILFRGSHMMQQNCEKADRNHKL